MVNSKKANLMMKYAYNHERINKISKSNQTFSGGSQHTVLLFGRDHSRTVVLFTQFNKTTGYSFFTSVNVSSLFCTSAFCLFLLRITFLITRIIITTGIATRMIIGTTTMRK